MKDIIVLKKNGTMQAWDDKKITIAISKSAERVNYNITDAEKEAVLGRVKDAVDSMCIDYLNVETLHHLVESSLDYIVPAVAKSYRDYRDYKKETSALWDKVYAESNRIQFLGDKENSNADSSLVSTKRTLTCNALSKELYRKYFLNTDEIQAVTDGYIYIHDMSARRDTMNCCLFNMAEVLKGGFEMSNVWYNEPTTVKSATSVIGDVTLMAASQQYGGFTIPEVDKLLAIFARKSYMKYMDEAAEWGIERQEEYARKKTLKDIADGYQGWEYKFNTVASSRGDYPFITITLGLSEDEWGKEVSKIILDVHSKGQGKKGNKKAVLFPKIVFLYDEKLHGPGMPLEDVFDAGVDCSSRTMYPDWLSMSGEGYISSMYQKYGTPISPMGCRAFLGPWYERGGMTPADDNDRPVFVGRFNIGAISLHLPMILAKARRENKDFYEVLDYYMEMIRKIHLRTYEYIGKMRASCNPLAYCEGGFYGGHLGYSDRIEPLLKSATASFGITALNELQQLYNKKSIAEDGEFALEVMKHINEKITEYKKADGRIYAIYGTPAENLCGVQIKQFRKMYGVIENVSDREYVSNSFHCHVSEDITSIEKQNLEYRFWELFNGGKIQYVRYPINYNKEAIKTLIRRAMKMGFYEGVNLALSYCDNCGHEELNMDVCPKCGSRNITKTDRMNGYLSYSRVKGDSRLNEAKMEEIRDRVSM